MALFSNIPLLLPVARGVKEDIRPLYETYCVVNLTFNFVRTELKKNSYTIILVQITVITVPRIKPFRKSLENVMLKRQSARGGGQM